MIKKNLLTLSAILIATLLTFWIFQDFRKQWKASKAFNAITNNPQLSVRHLFVSPEQLGIREWKIGDTVVYRLKTNSDSKQITLQVSAQAGSPHDAEFWLKESGLAEYNKVPIDIWRLLSPKSLRHGTEKAGFIHAKGTIPLPFENNRVPQTSVILEYVGDEDLKTAIGTFKCQHYFAQIHAPDGSYAPLLELWSNPSVLPIGIVRARWQDQVLELLEIRSEPVLEIPEMLSKVIESPQRKTYRQTTNNQTPPSACSQCHETETGGKSIKLEGLTAMSGAALEIPRAFYHHYNAKLASPHDNLLLRLTSRRGKRLAFHPLRFTSTKGSFRVRVNASGSLVLRLDETVHQSKIRITTEKGQRVLIAATTSITY